MSPPEKRIIGVKVINIIEENAQAIEDMVNRAITETHNNGAELLDIQTTEDHIFLILCEK
ncbi:MAG: hypothetical protein ACE5EK_09725 [Nitrospinales bacterium]